MRRRGKTEVVRLLQRPKRTTAICTCGWTTVSTGRQAIQRVVSLAMGHRCW